MNPLEAAAALFLHEKTLRDAEAVTSRGVEARGCRVATLVPDHRFWNSILRIDYSLSKHSPYFNRLAYRGTVVSYRPRR